MIPVGTLCLLVGDHSRAGQCCTIVAFYGLSWHIDRLCFVDGYQIDLASGEPVPAGVIEWGAARDNLLPLSPPAVDAATLAMFDRAIEMAAA